MATRNRREARPGQIMPLFALTLIVFIGAAMLAVDLSRLRTEAENVQRTAEASSLAGVVFLPNFKAAANFRALEEATANGFVDGDNNVSVVSVPVGNNRLQVTISEPVNLIFGGVLGLPSATVSRSATAEYALPLEMGSPDYVLGYANFPSHLSDRTAAGNGAVAPENYYLEARGSYGFQDNGDAYSSYLEAYPPGNRFANSSGGSMTTLPFGANNVCGATTAGCATTMKNPDRSSVSFTGYDYIIENPITQTLIVKLYDPYDETSYKAIANTQSFKYIDQPGPTVPMTSGNSSYTTALQWTLYGPGIVPNDPSMKQITPTVTSAGASSCSANIDCTVDPNFVTGDDPYLAKCAPIAQGGNGATWCNNASNVSIYADHLVNYAVIHGQGVYRLHLNSTTNANNYGTNGNTFGLAVCAAPSAGIAPLGTSGNVSAGGLAVASPATGTTWNNSACPSPNSPTTCPNPNIDPPGSCVHIYGLGRMCIINILGQNTKSMVPLGYVPTQYNGKSLFVHLYDVGDIGGNNGASWIEPLTPAGDQTTFDGNKNTLGGTLTQAYPSALSYSWLANPTDAGLPPNIGYPSVPLTNQTEAVVGDTNLRLCIGPGCPVVSNGQQSFQGSWLSVNIPIPSDASTPTYTSMVSNFGGYWKMLYDLGPGVSGADTTTWEISVAGSPVHLISS